MSTITEKIPAGKQKRVTVIEFYISGVIGNAIYLHHTDPTDTDEAVRAALEDRFPGAVSLRNFNAVYQNDIDRIVESFLIGNHSSKLKIGLRTFSAAEVTDNYVELTVYWMNLPDTVQMPDMLVFHDCNEFDCSTITRQVLEIQPVDRPNPKP